MKRAGTIVVTVILAVAAAIASAPTAVAAVPAVVTPAVVRPAAVTPAHPLEYSLDNGASWSSTPPTSMFAGSFLVVPGDTLSSTLLVRSTRSTPTVIMVALTNAATNDVLFDGALTVAGTDGSSGLSASRLSALSTCEALVPTRVMTTGQVLPLTLMLAVSPTLTQREAHSAVARFDLAIGLTDPGAPTTPNGCPIDPVIVAGFATTTLAAGTPLAFTGTDLVYPGLALGALAFGSGWFLVILARRRRQLK